MSMLAEKKRKQKWSLNPRGKDWAQDTNKFGHKMLEKMGWSTGKGLGAKEDGITEHIKVSYKNDSMGLGHKDLNDQWTEHETNFSALLSSLGGTETAPEQIKVSSLEEKSQKSRARVHYKKFTRGKDLSRYSEKDLANIFGKKSMDDMRKPKSKKSDNQSENKNSSNEENQPKSNFIINSGLMSDYFKKKLPSFGNVNGFVVGNNGVLKKADEIDKNSESESEIRPSFGFGFQPDNKAAKILGMNPGEHMNSKTTFVSFVSDQSSEETPTKKNKKKRKSSEQTEVVEIETPSKKQKVGSSEDTPSKKKKSKISEGTMGLSNPAFNPLHSTPIKIQKHTLDVIEESISEDTIQQEPEHLEVSIQFHKNEDSFEKKKKNKKDHTYENDNESPKKKGKQLDFSEDSLEISPNSISKKKKKSTSEDSFEIDLMNSQDSVEISPRKKSKNNKNKNFAIELENTNSEIETFNYVKRSSPKNKLNIKNTSSEIETSNALDVEMTSPKKKSKKNRHKLTEKNNLGLENPFFNSSIESEDGSISQENPFEVKIKKKQKKNKKNKQEKDDLGLENPYFSQTNESKNGFVDEIFEVKRKKSKKDKERSIEENKEVGLDNPALNLSSNIEENCELMLNIAINPVITQQKPTYDDHAYFKTTTVQRRKSVRFSDITKERIIPTKEEIKKMEESQDSDIDLDSLNESLDIEGRLKEEGSGKYSKLFKKKKKSKKNKIVGLDNGAYDAQKNNLEENLNSISKTLDQYQAELENDINEAKIKSVEISDIMIGEVGNDHGENERLSDGSVKLKFKYAKFKKSFKYHEAMLGPKKTYKHLIKGDITVDFKETNLHEIQGYAAEKV